MRWLRLILLIVCMFCQFNGFTCTIVAVSGSAIAEGRPLLMKNRDSDAYDIMIKIGVGFRYGYLCQCNVPDGTAYSGFNETGFAIINSHSYNMPNSDYEWNAYLMQLALERCATVADFEHLLDSLPKPISVCSNYGVMDAANNVAIYETNAYTYTKYDANETDCGYIIRTNFSFSQDTTGINTITSTSVPRYQIAANYLEELILTNGYIDKDQLFGLSRCLINCEGVDLRDYAPFDENIVTPFDFRFYVPRYNSTSAMLIQGVLPNENPNLTVAWTSVGPALTTVTVPFMITPRHVIPQKAQMGADGHSWFSNVGQQLKNICFIDNHTLDLAKLYNLSGTGVLQKIMKIEESIVERGDELIAKLRNNNASCYDIEAYYAWVDYYAEEQYCNFNLAGLQQLGIETQSFEIDNTSGPYYDLLGRPVKNLRDNSIIIKKSNKTIIIK